MDPATLAVLVSALTPALTGIISAFRSAGVPAEDAMRILDTTLAMHYSEIEILRARLGRPPVDSSVRPGRQG
jgi:hypothetical protein